MKEAIKSKWVGAQMISSANCSKKLISTLIRTIRIFNLFSCSNIFS